MDEKNDYPESLENAEHRIEIEFRDDETEDEDQVEAAAEHDSGVLSLEQDVERLQSELEQMRENYLRKLAEFDNFRKRTEREREELRKAAADALIRDLLPVLDNFERALQHAGNSDPEAFRQGVEMIANQLRDMLEREGLAAVDPAGQPFDPELHEAVDRVEGSEHPPGTVVSVLAKGFTLSGRLLRPAMVAVAVEPVETGQPAPSDNAGTGEGGDIS
jgi:molecular chaperone GrpE